MSKNKRQNHKNQATSASDRPTIGFLNASGIPFFHMAWHGVADVAREHNINAISFVGQYMRHTQGFKAQANIVYDLVTPETCAGLATGAAALEHSGGKVEPGMSYYALQEEIQCQAKVFLPNRPPTGVLPSAYCAAR
jgi:hypothetical protein